MTSKWTKWFLALLAILLPLWVIGGTPIYFAKDIRGQVVDADTGAPLEGVIVVARWILFWIGPGHGGHGGALNTIEVVTDIEGRYHIPDWGPRPRPPFSFLDYRDPELRFFKSSYYPESVENTPLSEKHRNRNTVRSSEWDGKVIKLRPFKGDWFDYGFNKLGGFWGESGDCLRECPRLVLALDAESKRIKAQAPSEPFIPWVVDIETFSAGDKEFLRSFGK